MKQASHTALMVIEWLFVGICVVIVIARLAIRTYKRMWKFWLSEVWLVLSVTSFTILVGGTQYTWSTNIDNWPDKSDVGYNKWKFFLTFILDTGYYFPRFSLLAFYHELFPISEERLRKVLYFTMAFTACAFVTDAILMVFWCGLPVSKNWSTNINDCTIYLVIDVYKITWPIGLASELLIFLLPFGMLKRLKVTPRGERVALLCLFSVGIITIILTIIRFTFELQSVYTYSSTIISSAEIASQIIVCALPALRPLLPMMAVGWTRISSIVRKTETGSSEDTTLKGSISTMGRKENSTEINSRNVAELGAWNEAQHNMPDLLPPSGNLDGHQK